MSRDSDPNQRKWLSLGYGGKNAPATTWRYWKKPNQTRQWVISAPNDLAEFEQHDRTVFHEGVAIHTAKTQWLATWAALAYFYGQLLPNLPAPTLSGSEITPDPSSTRESPDWASRTSSSKSNCLATYSSKQEIHVGATGYPDRVWIGPYFETFRVLVLGESWYGDFQGDLVTDAGYIEAYLANIQVDRLYTKMANASGLGKQNFWKSVAFTNFVQRVGPTLDFRPTPHQYIDAQDRLCQLLSTLRPKGVWILGTEQGRYSEPIVREAGIACEVSPHPARRGVTKALLSEGWRTLNAAVQGYEDTAAYRYPQI
jgi:hypothetical protein